MLEFSGITGEYTMDVRESLNAAKCGGGERIASGGGGSPPGRQRRDSVDNHGPNFGGRWQILNRTKHHPKGHEIGIAHYIIIYDYCMDMPEIKKSDTKISAFWCQISKNNRLWPDFWDCEWDHVQSAVTPLATSRF
jgi:hypothetical protein